MGQRMQILLMYTGVVDYVGVDTAPTPPYATAGSLKPSDTYPGFRAYES